MKFAGLDIETTGLDAYGGHRLIQIGIVLPDGEKICHDVLPMGEMTIDPGAMEVNKFTIERIQAGTPNDELDETLSRYLSDKHYTPNELTPVGWNVGGFDMVFIKKELPKTSKFFSYRALDLTGVAIMHELRTGRSYKELKEEFHARIAEKLGRDKRHDALYDAEAALEAMKMFQEAL